MCQAVEDFFHQQYYLSVPFGGVLYEYDFQEGLEHVANSPSFFGGMFRWGRIAKLDNMTLHGTATTLKV